MSQKTRDVCRGVIDRANREHWAKPINYRCSINSEATQSLQYIPVFSTLSMEISVLQCFLATILPTPTPLHQLVHRKAHNAVQLNSCNGSPVRVSGFPNLKSGWLTIWQYSHTQGHRQHITKSSGDPHKGHPPLWLDLHKGKDHKQDQDHVAKFAGTPEEVTLMNYFLTNVRSKCVVWQN